MVGPRHPWPNSLPRAGLFVRMTGSDAENLLPIPHGVKWRSSGHIAVDRSFDSVCGHNL